MKNRLATTIIRILDRRPSDPRGECQTDRELLARFTQHRDVGAVATPGPRHGRRVHGVCGCLLCTSQDVEDAFQSTFVILARRARTRFQGASIGNWLYGVARRVALRLRKQQRPVYPADDSATTTAAAS